MTLVTAGISEAPHHFDVVLSVICLRKGLGASGLRGPEPKCQSICLSICLRGNVSMFICNWMLHPSWIVAAVSS